MKHNIQHIWFDMDGTLTVHTAEFDKVHDALRYKTYSEVIGRPVDDQLIAEFNELYAKYASNSAVFTSLGKPSDFWMHQYATIDQNDFYQPIPDVYETLEKLRTIVPISLFTNDRLGNAEKTLSVVGVDMKWFTHVISGDDIANRKPALDGFHLMIERSGLPADQILYVGDRVGVDIEPAKLVGMKTCLVYGESEVADFSFKKLSGLLTLI
jgi:HAD superfamily hydrolase (TIGR01549 family)